MCFSASSFLIHLWQPFSLFVESIWNLIQAFGRAVTILQASNVCQRSLSHFQSTESKQYTFSQVGKYCCVLDSWHCVPEPCIRGVGVVSWRRFIQNKGLNAAPGVEEPLTSWGVWRWTCALKEFSDMRLLCFTFCSWRGGFPFCLCRDTVLFCGSH